MVHQHTFARLIPFMLHGKKDCASFVAACYCLKTSSSAVAKRLRNTSCLSEVSFNSTKR